MSDLAQLESHKHTLFAHVEDWPASRLNFHPAPSEWSASEVFDHLVKTEEAILDAAKRGLAAPHKIGFRDRAGVLFIEKIFQTDRRVKVPASAAQVLPGPAPDMSAIRQRWQTVRGDLAAFHASLSPAQMKLGIFRHPVGGWMAMPQVVTFFHVHMVHHNFQLARLAAASS